MKSVLQSEVPSQAAAAKPVQRKRSNKQSSQCPPNDRPAMADISNQRPGKRPRKVVHDPNFDYS